MARTTAKKLVTLRINPQQLTEDEADFLFYLKHKNDRRYTLDQVAEEFGYEVEVHTWPKAHAPICVKLPERIRLQVFKRIASLEEDPFPHGYKKLKTPSELYRLRSGDYRVVYTVDRKAGLVDVIRARNRKEAYRGL